MRTLESLGTEYNELGDTDVAQQYHAIQKVTERYRHEHKKSLVVGSLLYLFTHPRAFMSAQKYYSGKFGKPCEIR